MIYITMVTLACSPLELVPSDELELHSICITFMASVSQLPLGMLYWVEASLIHQMCIRIGACFSVFTPYSLSSESNLSLEKLKHLKSPVFILDKCVMWKVKTSGDVFVMPEKSEPSKED